MWLGLGHTDRVEVCWAVSYLWSWLEELDIAWPIRSPSILSFLGVWKVFHLFYWKDNSACLILLVSLELCGQGPCAPNTCTHTYILAVLGMEPGAACMPGKSLTTEPRPGSTAAFLLCSGCRLSCANTLEFSQVTSAYVEISEALT